MKIVLDVESNIEPKENDLFIFKDGRWKVISKENFLAKLVENQQKENLKLEREISELKDNLSKLAKLVKEK